MPTIVLKCDGFDETETEWTETGTSPYLDVNDGDTNKISTGTVDTQERYFTFQDPPPNIGTITEVLINFVVKETGGGTYIQVDVYDHLDNQLVDNWNITEQTIQPYQLVYYLMLIPMLN